MELGTPLLEDEVSESQTQEYFENLELHSLVSKLQSENIRLHAALRRSETVINQLSGEYLKKNPLWKDMTPEQKIKRNSEISLRGQVKSAEAVKMPSYDAQLKMYEEQIENFSPEIKFLLEKLEENRAKKEEALAKNEEPVPRSFATGTALIVDSLEKDAEPFLSEKAKEKMAIKSKSMIANIDDKYFRSTCYSFTTSGSEEKAQAVKLLSEIANELTEKDFLHSVLSPISELKLSLDLDVPISHVVFFMPLVPVDKENELPRRDWIAPEGMVGPKVPMP